MSGADGKIGEANHPRNEPTPPRDVASVQRFVIQITGHAAPNILASRPVEVEHDVRMDRAPCVHGGFAERSARSAAPVNECLLPRLRPSVPEYKRSAFEQGPSAFDHELSMAERNFASVEYEPSMTDLNLDNVNDHRAATSDSPFQNARTSPLRVHRIVIPRFS